MTIQLPDAEIEALIAEVKHLPVKIDELARLQTRGMHRRRDVEVQGVDGHLFRIMVRQSVLNPMNFSVVLAYCPSGSNRVFRLRRYNGPGSPTHRNRLDSQMVHAAHIHMATERYQDGGFDEDAYAEASSRFSDLGGAIRCLLTDCGFSIEGLQSSLFDEEVGHD